MLHGSHQSGYVKTVRLGCTLMVRFGYGLMVRFGRTHPKNDVWHILAGFKSEKRMGLGGGSRPLKRFRITP